MGRRRLWQDAGGAAMLELVFALPILLLLLLGGLMLGQYIFTSLSLNWHVFDRSEELAARTTFDSLLDAGVNLYEGESQPGLSDSFEAYSFPVPVGEKPFVVSVACYPIPFQWPHFDFDAVGTRTPAADEKPAAGLLGQVNQLLEATHRYLQQGDVLIHDANDVVDDLVLARQLAVEVTSLRPDTKRQGIRQIGSWAAEAAMGLDCREDGQLVVTSKAVAWSEQTKALKAQPWGLGKK